jgi:hypothetical protein
VNRLVPNSRRLFEAVKGLQKSTNEVPSHPHPNKSLRLHHINLHVEFAKQVDGDDAHPMDLPLLKGSKYKDGAIGRELCDRDKDVEIIDPIWLGKPPGDQAGFESEVPPLTSSLPLAYIDASHEADRDDRKSHPGYVFFYNGDAKELATEITGCHIFTSGQGVLRRFRFPGMEEVVDRSSGEIDASFR